MKRMVKLPSLANVAAGQTATLNVPVGRTYDKIQLETNVAPADLTNIEVVINGKTIQQYASGLEVDEINGYYGREVGAGFITLYFARPEFAELEQQRITAIGTADVQTFQLRMDIDAAAVSPSIVAHAVTSPQQPLGLITKVKSFPYNSAVSGEVEVDNIPRGPRIIALHMYKADVNKVTVEGNSTKLVEMSKTLAEQWQQEWGRVPVTAKATHVDFCLDGDISQAMVTQGLQDFRIRMDLGTSGAVRQVVEYLDGFAGI